MASRSFSMPPRHAPTLILRGRTRKASACLLILVVASAWSIFSLSRSFEEDQWRPYSSFRDFVSENRFRVAIQRQEPPAPEVPEPEPIPLHPWDPSLFVLGDPTPKFRGQSATSRSTITQNGTDRRYLLDNLRNDTYYITTWAGAGFSTAPRIFRYSDEDLINPIHS